MMSRPGARLRAQNTAMGKVLLANLPDDDAARRFDPAAASTPNSIRSLNDFLGGLHAITERGFAVEDQENELGISCVAIGIPDGAGRITAAISVSAPSVHLPPQRYDAVLAELRAVQPVLSPLLPTRFETQWGVTG